MIFAALFALSQFITGLPSTQDFQSKPRSEIVTMYSDVCLRFISGPFEGVDMTEMLKNAILSSHVYGGKESSSKSKLMQFEGLFTKICKKNPDPNALAEYEEDLIAAVQKVTELKKDLPDVKGIKNLKLAESTELVAADGSVISDIYEKNNRRKWVSIKDLPPYVTKTFVAVEDRRFFEHKGVDEFGILRAIMKNSTSTSRPQGASTLTQQVARNIYLDDSLSTERKIKEILLAGEIEKTISKPEILEIYVNLIYFGRNSWGIEKAAKSYFNKEAKNLSVGEAAFLVGLVHAPNLYQAKNARTIERLNFVLNKMVDEKVVSGINIEETIDKLQILKPQSTVQTGFFRDFIIDELKAQGVSTAGQSIKTTLDSKFQRLAEYSLQEGLIAYEKASGKYIWKGPVGNIAATLVKENDLFSKAKEMKDLEKSKMNESLFSSTPAPKAGAAKVQDKPLPFWLAALSRISQKFSPPAEYWQTALVLDNGTTVGISDGSVGQLSPQSLRWVGALSYGDIVYVVKNQQGKYDLQQAPEINGAVTVMDVSTGEILAMVGGFNYISSPWNRAVKAMRQPGSTIKPWTYLAALQMGYQPNIMLSPKPLTFPPTAKGGQYWTPKNYENITSGPRPMRWALEQSYNIMTADLMRMTGLGPIRQLTRDFGIYENPNNNYPLILGAQETNLISMVRAYSAISNGGYLLNAHGVASPALNAQRTKIQAVDDVTLFQIRSLLQGVLQRGTAKRAADLAPYVAGKTGTSQDFKDAWFLGFTSQIAVGVYVGYDQPTTLNSGFTGGSVALPIAEKIFRGSDAIRKLQPFSGPPAGVTLIPTDTLRGEIQQTMTPTSVLEAYRTTRIPVKN